jgi:hypothetical protein
MEAGVDRIAHGSGCYRIRKTLPYSVSCLFCTVKVRNRFSQETIYKKKKKKKTL